MKTRLTAHVVRHVGLCFILAPVTNGFFWSALTRPGPLEHPSNSPKLFESQHDLVSNNPTGDKDAPKSDGYREPAMSALSLRSDDPGEKAFVEWSISILPLQRTVSMYQPHKRSFLKASSSDSQPVSSAPVSQKRHSIIVHRMPDLAKILEADEQHPGPRFTQQSMPINRPLKGLSYPHSKYASHAGQHYQHTAQLTQHPYQPGHMKENPYRAGQIGLYPYHLGEMEESPYRAGQLGQYPYHPGEMEEHSYHYLAGRLGHHPRHTVWGQHSYKPVHKAQHPYHAERILRSQYQTSRFGHNPFHTDRGQHSQSFGRLEQHPDKDDNRGHLPYRFLHMGQYPYRAGYVGNHRYHPEYTERDSNPNDYMNPKSTDDIRSREKISISVDDKNHIQGFHQIPSSPSQQTLDFQSISPVSFDHKLYSPHPAFVQEPSADMAGVSLSASMDLLEPEASLSDRPVVSTTQHPPDLPSTTSPVHVDSNDYSAHPELIQGSVDLTHGVAPLPSLNPLGPRTPPPLRKMFSSTQKPTDIYSTLSPDYFEYIEGDTPETSAGVSPLLTLLGHGPSSVRSSPDTSRLSPDTSSTTFSGWIDSNLVSSQHALIQESDDIDSIMISSPSMDYLQPKTQSTGSATPFFSKQSPEVFPSAPSSTLDPVYIQESAENVLSVTPEYAGLSSMDYHEPQTPSPGGAIAFSSQQTPKAFPSTTSSTLDPVYIQESAENVFSVTPDYAGLSFMDYHEPQTPPPGGAIPFSRQQTPQVYPSTITSRTLGPSYIQESADNVVSETLSYFMAHPDPQRSRPTEEIPSSGHQPPDAISSVYPESLYPNLQSPYSEFIQQLDENSADVVISENQVYHFNNVTEARESLKRPFPKTKLKSANSWLANRFKDMPKPLQQTLRHPPVEHPSRYARPVYPFFLGQQPYPAGNMGNCVIHSFIQPCFVQGKYPSSPLSSKLVVSFFLYSFKLIADEL